MKKWNRIVATGTSLRVLKTLPIPEMCHLRNDGLVYVIFSYFEYNFPIMNKVIVTCLILTWSNLALFAQSKNYMTCIKKGDSLYQENKFLQSALMYNVAFSYFGGKGFLNDRYNAARSWAMAGETDSALINLEKIVYRGRYGSHFRISTDTAFRLLHQNKRWHQLLDTSRAISIANQEKMERQKKLYEPELAARLDTVLKTDQFYRLKLRDTEKQYGKDSEEVKLLWAKIRYHDSINLNTVKQILDSRGWLGPEVVHGGSQALFLVIQHSDLGTQLHYLPMLRKAAKNGKLQNSSLAMLEDRVLMGQGKEQIYGTQIKRNSLTGKYYVAPLLDPEQVDVRRAEMGLGPIADYVTFWDLDWDVEAYKKELEKMEK